MIRITFSVSPTITMVGFTFRTFLHFPQQAFSIKSGINELRIENAELRIMESFRDGFQSKSS